MAYWRGFGYSINGIHLSDGERSSAGVAAESGGLPQTEIIVVNFFEWQSDTGREDK